MWQLLEEVMGVVLQGAKQITSSLLMLLQIAKIM